MKKTIILLNLLCFIACTERKQTQNEDAQPSIAKLLENYHENSKRFFPFRAMTEGDNRFNDQLPISIGAPFRKNLDTFYTHYLNQLQSIDKINLSKSEQLSFDILEWECKIGKEELKFPTHLVPLNQYRSMHLTIAMLGSMAGNQPFNTYEDYGNWANRMFQFVYWCDTAMINMRKGMKIGNTLPKNLALKLLPQITELANNSNIKKHLLYTPANNVSNSINERERLLIVNAYDDILELQLLPKLEELEEFIRDEYLPSCRETDGIGATPQGKDYYTLQAKKYTTTNLTPDEIFLLGEKEVVRISKEMDSIKSLIGFKGDLPAFFNHVRNNPELMPYNDPSEVIQHFNRIHDKIKPQLKQLFNKEPRSGFIVKRTEAFREASASAEYQRGLPDGSKPGIFYVPIPNVSQYNIFSDESLFLHEAIPGHHYQISLQMEDTLLPAFRKNLWYSSYGEGWALYCESLGKELGLYTEYYQYFGMLSAEMHRAIRLVIDVGIHYKGWTREEAIQYSLEHEAEPYESIIAEVERYMSWPGQALSYKIGQLKILELRAYAEAELGEKFDFKGFHDVILESGCIPLALLEQRVKSWVKSQG